MGRGWRGGEPRVAALAGAAVAADGAPSGHRRRASPESSSARTHRSRPIAQARCKGESPQGAPLASRPRLCGSSAHTAAKAGYLQASQAEVAMTAERNWREQGLLQGLILLRHVGSFQIASLGVIARTCNAIRPIGTSPPRGSPRSVPARASQEMPKPRKTAGPWIAVSPWQSKQDKGTVSKEPPGDEAAGYSEVELPLVVGSCGGGGATPAAAASDMAVDPLEEAAAAAHSNTNTRQEGYHRKVRTLSTPPPTSLRRCRALGTYPVEVVWQMHRNKRTAAYRVSTSRLDHIPR